MHPILAIAGPIIILSILIYIVAQMLARILNKPDIVAYVNMELLNIMVFLVLLSIILYLMDNIIYLSVQTLNPEAEKQVCQANNIPNFRCHIAIAGYFLESILREITDYYIQLNSILMMNNFFKYMGGVKGIQGDKYIKIQFNPLVHIVDGYTEPLIRQTQTMLQFALAQFIILWYITSPQFFIGFLTFGIILRLFAPTKTAGGLIIALILGLYYIFPMAYVLLDVHYTNAYDGIYGFNKINTFRITDHMFSILGLPSGLDNVVNSLTGFLRNYGNTTNVNAAEAEERIGGIAAAISQLSSLASILIKVGVLVSYMMSMQLVSMLPVATIGYGALIELAPSVKNNIINVPVILLNIYTEFFLIFGVLVYIALISTIAFVKTLSPILGGDVEIAGITRFI